VYEQGTKEMSFNPRDYTEKSLMKELYLIEKHSKDGSAIEGGCSCIEEKHLLGVEGYSEEGQGFGLSKKEKEFYAKTAEWARKLRKSIDEGSFNFPGNPSSRRVLSFGLTECERKHKNVRKSLSRCIKKLEKEGRVESPVAVCRASIKCPP